MSITAVVPVWNGRSDLERLLRSLKAQTKPAAELLAIDNGSTDGAAELARESGARVIAMGRNTGFVAAVNRGIREASGDWIAVLNSDVELAPDYFERLTAVDGWFATGKILNMTDPSRIDGTFDLVCRGGTAWRAGKGRPAGPEFPVPRAIFWVPWTAALFRAELFRKTGLLEEAFESYLEDVDFGFRCAAHGFAGSYVPEAIALHRGSASLGAWHPDMVRLIARNQLLLLARHYSATMFRRAFWPILVAQVLWGALALRHGRGLAWLRGILGRLPSVPVLANPRVLELLKENEAAIYRIQKATGFDWYWRMYFLLTGGAAK